MMTSIATERLALINTLQHAGEIYVLVAEIESYFKQLALKLSAERLRFAEELGLRWHLAAFDEIVTDAERDDVLRRGKRRVEDLGGLMLTAEQRIIEVLADMAPEAIDPESRSKLAATAEAAIRAIMRELLTLRASAGPDQEFDTAFSLSRKSIAPVASESPQSHSFKLWYGTNRSPSVQAGQLVGFSSERSERVHLGTCEVTIPKTHHVGSTGSPWWHRILHGDDRLRLAKIDSLETEQFWADVSTHLAATTEPRDAVIFIHGYNVSFQEAALRAAQIGADLALGGAMAFFSWPSRGRLLCYSADEATIEASEQHITDFLTDFANRSDARAVHVIAHSMGNRGLLRAVARIAVNAATRSSKPFGQIILAAPDVDSSTFRGLASAYPIVATRTTLYVSEGDLAVRASRLLHAADRIGFAPPISIVDGIDTVNVTGVDLSLLGHGYVSENRPVLQDMFDLLARGTEPARRAMVRALKDPHGRDYWEIAT